ncbi:MAG: DUF2490 domain-containing protein [Bacteroidota bacterium]
MKKILFTTLATIQLLTSFSQSSMRNVQTNNNTWFMYVGDHKVSERWGVHLEAQYRRNEIIAKPQQLLLRTGINYHFAPNMFATAGYCYVYTSQYGVFPAKSAFPENRFWEQLQVKTQAGRLEMTTRLRLEQRLTKLPVAINGGEFGPGDNVYTNRARMLVRFSIPFKGKTIEDKSLYFSCFDEGFVNFGRNVGMNIFDQNRAYVAIGYKIPRWGRVELGYLNQLLVKSDGVRIENNNTIQIGISSGIDFIKKKN